MDWKFHSVGKGLEALGIIKQGLKVASQDHTLQKNLERRAHLEALAHLMEGFQLVLVSLMLKHLPQEMDYSISAEIHNALTIYGEHFDFPANTAAHVMAGLNREPSLTVTLEGKPVTWAVEKVLVVMEKGLILQEFRKITQGNFFFYMLSDTKLVGIFELLQLRFSQIRGDHALTAEERYIASKLAELLWGAAILARPREDIVNQDARLDYIADHLTNGANGSQAVIEVFRY